MGSRRKDFLSAAVVIHVMQDNHIHIIAEMACSHDGDEALARKIIDGAASAGADAIQFQIWKPLEVSVPAHPDIPLLERIGLSYDVWRALRERQRHELTRSRLLAVYGVWQRDDDTGGQVRHLVARRLKDLTPLLGQLHTSSRDFH